MNNNFNPFNPYMARPQSTQTPNVSEDQFFALTSTLDKSSLQRLVAQARAKGISDQDIQAGLNILLQHR